MKDLIKVQGHCPICEKDVVFCSKHAWLRDHFFCSGCGSIPRERALMQVIGNYYSDYRSLKVQGNHFSSRLSYTSKTLLGSPVA